MRYEVSIALTIHMIFWVYIPCHVGSTNLCFRGTYCLHLQCRRVENGKWEVMYEMWNDQCRNWENWSIRIKEWGEHQVGQKNRRNGV